MSPRTWRELIEDIIACGHNILDFTSDMTLESFLDHPQTVRAVAYEFITIGEAARLVSQEIQECHPEVPWGKMQGLRNV